MKSLIKQIASLLLMIGLVSLLFLVGRIILFFTNKTTFEAFNTIELVVSLLKGIEYDILIVVFCNLIFIYFFLWPAKIYNSAFYQTLLKVLFFTFNIIILLIHLLDVRNFEIFGVRMRAFDIENSLSSIYYEITTGGFSLFISKYLSLFIYLIIFIIILWIASKQIKHRDIENKNLKFTQKIISSSLLFVLIGLSVYIGYFQNDWLSKLYCKTDKRLAPIVINNPYLILKTVNSPKPDLIGDWDFEQYKSEKEYVGYGYNELGSIKLIIFQQQNNDDIFVADSIKRKWNYYSVLGLRSNQSSIFKVLDELLLSFPGIFDSGFYQSAYSLNTFENLIYLLQKNNYSTKLSAAGFDEKVINLIKNFYGLSESFEPDIRNEKKVFELILTKDEKEYQNHIIQALRSDGDNILIVNIFIDNLPNAEDNKLKKTISFISSKPLPFYSDKTITSQLLDIKPSILHLTAYNKPFISYGSSLFAREKRVVLQTKPNRCYKLLIDSLLLEFKDNETSEMTVLNNGSFSKLDLKDSLAVERILLENKMHSILNDYEHRLSTNELK